MFNFNINRTTSNHGTSVSILFWTVSKISNYISEWELFNIHFYSLGIIFVTAVPLSKMSEWFAVNVQSFRLVVTEWLLHRIPLLLCIFCDVLLLETNKYIFNQWIESSNLSCLLRLIYMIFICEIMFIS